MKELKFRAWDSNTRIMYYSNENHTVWAGGLNGSVVGNGPSLLLNDVMQFTGLLDKNGKEIYEGDIVQFFDKPVAVIEWDFNGFVFRWIDPAYLRVRQFEKEPIFRNINLFEVIGNIYENPELLKDTV